MGLSSAVLFTMPRKVSLTSCMHSYSIWYSGFTSLSHLFSFIRPPGHHSQRSAANGFCVFNNVAIAAHYAKKQYGIKR